MRTLAYILAGITILATAATAWRIRHRALARGWDAERLLWGVQAVAVPLALGGILTAIAFWLS